MKKKKFIIVTLLVTIFSQPGFAQDTVHSRLSPLLIAYYQVKDALVAGNTANSTLKAKEFMEIAKGIDNKILPEGSIDALLKDAGSISKSKDIKKQREYFASFSATMFALAKATKLSEKTVFQQYCPMKKASWLSSTNAIKNPYYGSAMLTCGEVVETINN